MPDAGKTSDAEYGRRIIASGRIQNISAMHDFAAMIANLLQAGDLLVLTGELGAGKTTFTRGLAAALGVEETVSSPTFILARQHEAGNGPALIHLDAYRLTGAAELDDLALDFAESVTVAEWGKGLIENQFSSWLELELVPEPLDLAGMSADEALAATLDVSAERPRTFRLWATGARWNDVRLG